jgi:CheY-like chemotaxis protein
VSGISFAGEAGEGLSNSLANWLDVLLLDVTMPKLGGLEVLQRQPRRLLPRARHPYRSH